MSPLRKDGAGRPMVGTSWEGIAERLIREAQERGEFDDLPHRGVPLPVDDDAAAGDRALAFRVLRNAGIAPPWIEAEKEARALLAERDRLLDRARLASPVELRHLERRLAELVPSVNSAIARLNAEAPTPAQHRRPLDLERELAALRSRASGRADGPEPGGR